MQLLARGSVCIYHDHFVPRTQEATYTSLYGRGGGALFDKYEVLYSHIQLKGSYERHRNLSLEFRMMSMHRWVKINPLIKILYGNLLRKAETVFRLGTTEFHSSKVNFLIWISGDIKDTVSACNPSTRAVEAGGMLWLQLALPCETIKKGWVEGQKKMVT